MNEGLKLTVPLIPSRWRINDPQTGPQPTDIQFQAVLGNLIAIRLAGDWGNGFETTGLDNVKNFRVHSLSLT